MVRRLAPLFLLALAACGRAQPAAQDLDSLDRQLTAPGQPPALATTLHDQIMVDPQLVQQANIGAVRPPPRPDPGAMPPDDLGAPRDTSTPADLRRTPAAIAGCPDCTAARGALTLGALAERSSQASVAACSGSLGYATAWAERLPAALPLYPDARIAEAAGSDARGCALRIVSFASAAPIGRVTDWFYAHATRAGYAADHRADGADRVLRGARTAAGAAGGRATFMLYLRPRAGGGSEGDLVVSGS